MNKLISNLKRLEAELLREAGEIEVALAQKLAEIQSIRRRMELQNDQGYPNPVGAEAAGRPTSETGDSDPVPESLTSLIEKLLSENKDGFSLIDLAQRITEVRGDRSKQLLGMIDQAIYRLKKMDRISRNPESMKFFLKDVQSH